MSRRYACDRPDCEACDKAIGHDEPQRFDVSNLDRLDWPAESVCGWHCRGACCGGPVLHNIPAGTFDRVTNRGPNMPGTMPPDYALGETAGQSDPRPTGWRWGDPWSRRPPWLVRKLWWSLADRRERLSDRHERSNNMGGKPSKGTAADKRLSENKPKPKAKPK